MTEVWINYLNTNIPAATDVDRAIIEQSIGNRLPDFYWNIAASRQGFSCEPDGVFLANGERVAVGFFLIVSQSSQFPNIDPSYSLLENYKRLVEYHPTEIVPFSDDTGGNYLAFDFRNPGEPSIVFVNHEVEGEDGLIWAAPNFATLIAGLFDTQAY